MSMVVKIICRCQISGIILGGFMSKYVIRIIIVNAFQRHTYSFAFDQRNALRNASLHKCHRLLCLYLAICLGTRGGGRWNHLWIRPCSTSYIGLYFKAQLCAEIINIIIHKHRCCPKMGPKIARNSNTWQNSFLTRTPVDLHLDTLMMDWLLQLVSPPDQKCLAPDQVSPPDQKYHH